MLILLFFNIKNIEKIITKLIIHQNDHLYPNEALTTNSKNGSDTVEIYATKIIKINPKDIHNKDLFNNLAFVLVASILKYFLFNSIINQNYTP